MVGAQGWREPGGKLVFNGCEMSVGEGETALELDGVPSAQRVNMLHAPERFT